MKKGRKESIRKQWFGEGFVKEFSELGYYESFKLWKDICEVAFKDFTDDELKNPVFVKNMQSLFIDESIHHFIRYFFATAICLGMFGDKCFENSRNLLTEQGNDEEFKNKITHLVKFGINMTKDEKRQSHEYMNHVYLKECGYSYAVCKLNAKKSEAKEFFDNFDDLAQGYYFSKNLD
jgi:hypothetical protein